VLHLNAKIMVVNILKFQKILFIAICEETPENVVTTKKKFVVSTFLIENYIYYSYIFMTLNSQFLRKNYPLKLSNKSIFQKVKFTIIFCYY